MASEHGSTGRGLTGAAVFLIALACLVAAAAPASASTGVWDRAWGVNVNGGGVFGVCTVAASCQTGTIGTGAGAFGNDGPKGVSIDASGNVYVADDDNDRIQKFDSSGNFVLMWGKDVNMTIVGADKCPVNPGDVCQAGAPDDGAGELNEPAGLDLDAAGNVYVSDQVNDRIQVFDSDGDFLRAWGKDVDADDPNLGPEICSADEMHTCQAGVAGGARGELDGPAGMETDGSSVYITEITNTRVQVFELDGDFVRMWGRNVNATDPSTNAEICPRPANSGDTCQAGAGGLSAGMFATPVDTALDAAGNVYVTDLSNQRVQKFGPGGDFILMWGRDVLSNGVGVNGFEICTAATIADCKSGIAGSLGGEMSSPFGIATDATGNVYLSGNGQPRIQKFDPSGGFVSTWGYGVNGGSGPELCTVAASCQQGAIGGLGGQFVLPGHLATDPAGGLYVSDRSNHRMQRFQPDPAPPQQPQQQLPVSPASPATGLRAAALKKCKKKKSKKARKKCRKKANKLPL